MDLAESLKYPQPKSDGKLIDQHGDTLDSISRSLIDLQDSAYWRGVEVGLEYAQRHAPANADAVELSHGYTCDLCDWGRDTPHTVGEYAVHLHQKHVSHSANADAVTELVALVESWKPKAYMFPNGFLNQLDTALSRLAAK